jgi:hypothetical protein
MNLSVVYNVYFETLTRNGGGFSLVGYLLLWDLRCLKISSVMLFLW